MVVEHNHQVIRNSEWIIDLGPEAGENGGQVLFCGKTQDFLKLEVNGNSKTLVHLRKNIAFKEASQTEKKFIEITGASLNNLKNIDVKFQINALNIVTGKSGAGKSSLVNNTLAEYYSKKELKTVISIFDNDSIKDIQIIDHKSIGKTPRSNPATYTGLSDEIRNLFTVLPDALQSKLAKKHFSFNTKGGRCEKCEGAGYQQIGMHLLGDVEILCNECDGKQFKPEVLHVKYNNKSIADIYALTVSEASIFFQNQPKIVKYLEALINVGLGYLKLNQRSSTLSGGEARRIKLAKNLVKKAKKSTLYIINEPSTGLHSHDISTLLNNIDQLIINGHTVVLVEQNQNFIKHADHLIELGPEGGEKGGHLIFQGPPNEILQIQDSDTAKALKGVFNTALNYETNIFDLFNPIELKGVSTHNLKNIDVNIPVNKITTITGVSGSGKSSLAFDTLFAEGRQSYAESFSSFVRNRLNLNSDAKYENINGLMPTIAINQQSVSKSERSTVGTMTDIYDYLRLLFSRVGKTKNMVNRLSASHFSFNHENGACSHCEGLGYQIIADADLLVSNPELSIYDGAIQNSKPGKFYGDKDGQYLATLTTVGIVKGINFQKPWKNLSQKEQHIIMFGTGDEKYKVNWQFKRKNREGIHEFETTWPGFLYYINEEYLRKANDNRKHSLLPIMKQVDCEQCNGSRLNSDALQYKVLDFNILEMCNIEVFTLLQEFRKQVVAPNAFSTNQIEQRAAQLLCGSIINGLDILDKLGLGYLNLSRKAASLSGGEGQRVRLAAGLAQDISGVCFILDEPTTGMHEKDLDNLYFMLHELKRQGNTIVVCEHDPGFIRYSDHVIELGPQGGTNGGQIIEYGEVNDILKSNKSIISKYLKPDYKFERKQQSIKSEKSIRVEDARANNLKRINVNIPLNSLAVIKGVSGSGKSSLLKNVLYNSYANNKAQHCKSIVGLEQFNTVVLADQKIPKGSSLSFVASYLDFYSPIRDLFVKQATNNSDLTKSEFSLAGKLGKCPNCLGKGFIKTSMDFLSDVYDTCDECKGQRFNAKVLQAQFKGKNIAELLNMTIVELSKFVANQDIHSTSSLLSKLGLGYLRSGQTLNTLSGGELQRLKLAKTLLNGSSKTSLFLLDEPTTGLHMKDVEQLMMAFDELLQQGHSLVIIEHHKTVIDNADYVIEMGPGAGKEGGEIIN